MHREGHLETSEAGISLSCLKKSREAKAYDGVSEKEGGRRWSQTGICEESHSAIWLTFNE